MAQRSIPALSRTCIRKMPSKAALLKRTRAQRIPFRPGVRYSNKGRIHSRRPILSSSLFACKTAADHTFRIAHHPPAMRKARHLSFWIEYAVHCSFNEYIGPLSIQRFENCSRLIVARLRPEDSHSMPLLARFRGLQSPQVKAGTRAEVRVMTVMSSSWPNSCAVCAMVSAGWTLRAAVRSKP